MYNDAFGAAVEIIRTLQSRGYEAFLVGGCVRDIMLGRSEKTKDYDVTTNARPEAVQEIFEHTVPVGAAFGVIIVVMNGVQIEVATYRADGDYSDGRRPDSVSYSDTAEEDVVRRDFTMNGLLLTTPMNFKVKGVQGSQVGMFDGYGIVDFVNGQEDINDRLVRAIGNARTRFNEDKLRMMRACRFVAQLDFRIEYNTAEAIREMAGGISQISRERVGQELYKLVSAPYAAKGLAEMARLGLLSAALPDYKPNFIRTLERFGFGRFPALGQPLRGMAMLLADCPYESVLATLDSLKLSSADNAIIMSAYMLQPVLYRTMVMTPAEIKRAARRPGLDIALDILEQSAYIGAVTPSMTPECHDISRITAQYRSLKPEDIRPKPLVTGADLIALGYTPGPVFTAILNEIETHQLNGKLNTRVEAEYYLDNEATFPKK